ncbi:MAG: hypothetical protein RIT45_3452, partial [Pseudomonadota bacterium]
MSLPSSVPPLAEPAVSEEHEAPDAEHDEGGLPRTARGRGANGGDGEQGRCGIYATGGAAEHAAWVGRAAEAVVR